MQEKPQLNIDFQNTTSVEGFDGGKLFGQAVVIRKVSKFLVGSDEDMLIPVFRIKENFSRFTSA